jgi:hypothetical protein
VVQIKPQKLGSADERCLPQYYHESLDGIQIFHVDLLPLKWFEDWDSDALRECSSCDKGVDAALPRADDLIQSRWRLSQDPCRLVVVLI